MFLSAILVYMYNISKFLQIATYIQQVKGDDNTSENSDAELFN